MDALFIAELNERLFTHFTGGLWRVPYAQRHLPVHRADGARLGQIVCADAADIARARAELSPTGAAAQPDAMQQALAGLAEPLAALRREEGFQDTAAPLALAPPAGGGPVVLMTAAAVPPLSVGAALIALAGRGVIWKPAPRAAASAHYLMRHLGPMAAGRLALLQGDHATGQLMARGAAPDTLLWASPAAPPPELRAQVLALA